MAVALEELIVTPKGVFLTGKHADLQVTVVPVAPPLDIRADRLGNPQHNYQVLDLLFKEYPGEMRGFSRGVAHDYKVAVQYFRYTLNVQPEPLAKYKDKEIEVH